MVFSFIFVMSRKKHFIKNLLGLLVGLCVEGVTGEDDEVGAGARVEVILVGPSVVEGGGTGVESSPKSRSNCNSLVCNEKIKFF